MKKLHTLLLLFSICNLAFAQTEAESFKKRQLENDELNPTELIDRFLNTDFSMLFTQTDNSVVYGFIGANYQRMRIKFISVTKSQSSPDTYEVYGKSMVKNNICEFNGTIKISNVRKFKKTSFGLDDELKNKELKGQFVIIGSYSLSEDEKQNHSGVFKGTFQANFYLDKNSQFHYDDIENYSDGYNNNQFVGQWAGYKTKIEKRCNWGDFRIPNSGDFDIGAGDFSPDDKYLKFGWQSIRDLMIPSNNKIAKHTEEATWWR